MTKKQRRAKAQRPPSGRRGRTRKAKGHDALPRRPAGEADHPLTAAKAQVPAERKYPGQSALMGEHAGAPLWAPQGIDLELVPEEVRRAIAEVVEPVYQRFVLDAHDPLEKSLGVTVAHLVWLEVLQQFDLKREYTQVSAVLGLAEDRRGVIDQHLRIIHSKVKVGYLLARLREIRQERQDPSPDATPPPQLPDPFAQ